MVKKAAVFLDRDGTIIEDRGHLKSPHDVHFFSATVTSLQQLGTRYEVFIVTHQPGVSRGLVTLDEVAAVNNHVVSILKENNVHIRDVFVCPHEHSDGCCCIKPLPYFLFKAADMYALDLARSYVIGDHPHDVHLAKNAGSHGIYVLTGHGEKHRAQLPEDALVLNTIADATRYILDRSR